MNGGETSARRLPLASATTPSNVSAREPPKHSTLASALRQSTPLGMPVVPPVYRMYRSSALHSTAGRAGDDAASASSYHTAPGSSPIPESSGTWMISRREGTSGSTSASVGANRLCTTMAVARASRSTYPSSSAT